MENILLLEYSASSATRSQRGQGNFKIFWSVSYQRHWQFFTYVCVCPFRVSELLPNSHDFSVICHYSPIPQDQLEIKRCTYLEHPLRHANLA